MEAPPSLPPTPTLSEYVGPELPASGEHTYVGWRRIETEDHHGVSDRCTSTVFAGESIRDVLARDAALVFRDVVGAVSVLYRFGPVTARFTPAADEPRVEPVGADYPAGEAERDEATFVGEYAVEFRSGYVLRDNAVLRVAAGESLRLAGRREASSWFRFMSRDPALSVTYSFGALSLRFES